MSDTPHNYEQQTPKQMWRSHKEGIKQQPSESQGTTPTKQEHEHLPTQAYMRTDNGGLLCPRCKQEVTVFDTPTKPTWDGDTIDTIVRDYTSVAYPKSKSELHRRISSLLTQREKEVVKPKQIAAKALANYDERAENGRSPDFDDLLDALREIASLTPPKG